MTSPRTSFDSVRLDCRYDRYRACVCRQRQLSAFLGSTRASGYRASPRCGRRAGSLPRARVSGAPERMAGYGAAMRAVMCRQYGPPESLTVEDVEEPTAKEGQVVVDVKACAVNFPDVLIIQNLYQFKPPLPFSPGAEIAGVVRSVGSDVEGVRVGDRVFASTGWGGLAEQIAVDARSLIPIPDGIDYGPASSFLYAYGTAHHALKDRGRIRPGETLVVLGAAGGVGLAAVELGALLGGTVIAGGSSDDKLELCREYGAAKTIDYTTEDLKTRIRELTGGVGADVVYDPVGGPYSEPALRATAWEGRFLVIGFAAGEIP